MGAEIQTTIITSSVKRIHATWSVKHKSYCYDHGHAGYSGTFAEKPEIEVVSGLWEEEDAEDHGSSNNEKWGPASAYQISEKNKVGECEFLVVGICSC